MKTIKFSLYIVLVLLLTNTLVSCEEEYIPKGYQEGQQYVVEGYIEASENPIPPFVIISKSIPYFSEIDANTLNEIYVRDAEVKVIDGENEYELTLLCLNDITEELRPIVKSSLGLDPENSELNICVYIDILRQINVEEEKTYKLKIRLGDTLITSSTYIPKYIPLDSLWTKPIPGEPIDTLRQLYAKIKDPKDEKNFYRLKNSYVGEPLQSPAVSVATDDLFDGQEFKFVIDKAVNATSPDSIELEDFFFITGDTIQLQWICIDQEQYEFWNTLELDRRSQGPFSSYIRAKSNVEGALGVWSGSSSRIYQILCK